MCCRMNVRLAAFDHGHHRKFSANDLTMRNFLIKFHYKYLFEMTFFYASVSGCCCSKEKRIVFSSVHCLHCMSCYLPLLLLLLLLLYCGAIRR